MSLDPWDWQEQAACANSRADSEDFFSPRRSRRAKRAKTFCAVCPVRSQCLEAAFLLDDTQGIWGGLDEAERAELITTMRSRT